MVNIGDPGNNKRPSSISGIEIDSSGNMNSNNYENNPGSSNSNGSDSQRKNDEKRVTYTMPGVLHFLQHEWNKIELEKTQWEMEKAELKARISFLLGERKAQENLKRDLVRRIKMLEFSLKQERIKLYRTLNNGQDPETLNDDEKPDFPDVISEAPIDVEAVINPNEDPAWKRARLTLKQYLEEMNYSEELLNVRAFRATKLIGKDAQMPTNDEPEYAKQILDETEKEILDTADFLKKYNLKHMVGSDEENEAESNLDAEATEALDEFKFLNQEEKTSTTKRGTTARDNKSNASSSEWGIDASAFNEMKERYKSEQQRKRQLSHSSEKLNSDSDSGVDNKNDNYVEENLPNYPADGSDVVDIKDEFALTEDDGLNVKWNLKYTLRSHYDSVRALQFHPCEPVLITASEDGTAKLWNLSDAKNQEVVKAQGNSPSGITDVEPVYTFRGHETPILAMDMSPTGDNLYTADLDGVIQCWQVPSANIELHGQYDSGVMQSRFIGHKDAVWSINYHSSTNRLISASADATIKLWDLTTTEESEYLLNTIDFKGIIPRSMDVVSAEPQQLVVAFSNKTAQLIDLETGAVVLTFEIPADEEIGPINKIISHPTMSMTVLAGDDRKIRYFDNKTGAQIYGAVAHVESISTLAMDPNGLYLMSGSHDGSLRIWNMEQRKCLQEIAAHRKKFDMSVLSVAFHPSMPIIASGGADGLAKIFSSQKIIGNVSSVVTDESTA